MSPIYGNEKRTDNAAPVENITPINDSKKDNLDSYRSPNDNIAINHEDAIEIDDASYDEADSVNEENLNSEILNSNENRVCTKM